jgi:adenosylcobalamin-dependent ribonucleoside-triphosphate reductase
MGFNPCVEQQLEDAELCCLVETFPAKHEDLDDYLRTLKIAYLYGKTITLSSTHWPETNAKMLKNRRIGLSQSGVVQAFNKFGRRAVYEWCDKGYAFVKELDAEFSNWLCIPRSVRMTSIKPSGTVSLLNGSTPGIHFPESEYYIRRIRFSQDSSMLTSLKKAGHHIEDDAYSPNTVVVEFPVHEPYFMKGKCEVSIWEQLEIAAQYQYYWADNSVSVTITFQPNEATQIKSALEMYETRLKAVSFLKYEETGYKQAPYEAITKEEYEKAIKKIKPLQRVKDDEGGSGTKFCTNDTCTI